MRDHLSVLQRPQTRSWWRGLMPLPKKIRPALDPSGLAISPVNFSCNPSFVFFFKYAWSCVLMILNAERRSSNVTQSSLLLI